MTQVVNTWIRTVLERGCLHLYLETGFLYFIDTQFFTSNTLVELTISHEFCLQGLLPPGGVFFPKLKTLSLHGAYVDSNIYELFITGCPVLEELLLHYDDNGRPPPLRNAIVSSLSVKRLTIVHYFPDYPSGHLDCRIQTPGLVYLDYSSYAADQYEVDLASLVEARLNILSWERLNDWGRGEDDSVFDCPDYGFADVTNLVAGISNIKTLHLSPDSLEVFYFRCNSMPVFHNLLTLSFESDKDRGWQVVPLLINNSPNLETLVIKGLVHQVTRRCGNACVCVPKKQKKKNKKRTEERVCCCLSTCQVKVLNISAYGGTCRELKQMRHFLGNLKFLETVNVGVEVNHGEDDDLNNKYLRITDDLMQLPRVSSNCRIHCF